MPGGVRRRRRHPVTPGDAGRAGPGRASPRVHPADPRPRPGRVRGLHQRRAASRPARAAITAKGGIFDEAEDWWGDVWQGIRDGVNAVGEVFVNVADSVIEIVVTLADGVIAVLQAAWDDILTAAHAVEAAFVAIGAAIEDAIAWLKWAFDFNDVINFAQHLDANVRQLPGLVRPLLDEFEPKLHGFFLAQEETVHQVFTNLKEQVLPNRTAGSLQTPLAGVPAAANNPAGTRAADQAQGPHASWLTDKLTGPTGTNPAAGAAVLVLEEDLKARLDGLAEDFLQILTSSAAGSHLEAALEDFGKLFTNLFRAEDPQTAVAMELTTLFDLLEQLVEAGLGSSTTSPTKPSNGSAPPSTPSSSSSTPPSPASPSSRSSGTTSSVSRRPHPRRLPPHLGPPDAPSSLAFPTTVICKMITGQRTHHRPRPPAAWPGRSTRSSSASPTLVEIPLRTSWLTRGILAYSPRRRRGPVVSSPAPSLVPDVLRVPYCSTGSSFHPPATRAAAAAWISWVHRPGLERRRQRRVPLHGHVPGACTTPLRMERRIASTIAA